MKKFLFFMLMPLLAVTINSCSDNDKEDPSYEELIVGTWKMTEVVKVEGDNDDPSSFDLETIRFNSDKTFQFIEGSSGTYTISNKTISIKLSAEDIEEMEIVSLNNTEWIFKATYTDILFDPINGEQSQTTTYTVRAIKQ